MKQIIFGLQNVDIKTKRFFSNYCAIIMIIPLVCKTYMHSSTMDLIGQQCHTFSKRCTTHCTHSKVSRKENIQKC